MKSIYIKSIVSSFTALFMLLLVVSSCKKEEEGKGAPSITRLRTLSKTDSVTFTREFSLDSSITYKQATLVALDSTVTAGSLGSTYVIVGHNLATTTKVEFNGTEAYFNRALMTNETLIITIPSTISWQNQSGKLTLTNPYGVATSDFTILPPVPVITGVSQLAGNAGDEVTITGTVLDNVSSVTFGTAVARIISSSATQVVVSVPAAASGTIAVSTPGGRAFGPYVSYDGVVVPVLVPFGFSNVLYDDEIHSGYDFGFNGYEVNTQSAEVVKRGTSAIKIKYTGSYAGYAVGSGTPINITGKTYVKFSVYGGTGTEGKVIKVVVNDFDHRHVSVVLHAGIWSTYAIPLSLFKDSAQPGTPTTLNYIGFQELSGNAPETIYLDDIGVF